MHVITSYEPPWWSDWHAAVCARAKPGSGTEVEFHLMSALAGRRSVAAGRDQRLGNSHWRDNSPEKNASAHC